MLATAVGLAIAVALWASLVWSLNRPLNDLIRGTERIARGQFDEKIPVRAADELGRLAGSFNRMADALNDLERMKAEFLAAASHGLRTPLACAKGHLAGMQAGRQGPLSEDSRRTADRIEAELDRVSRFVDQLLDLGRIRAGRLNLDIRGLPAAAFFTSVGRSFEAVAQEKDVGYEIVVDEGMPGRIQADPDRLGEALTNLLENAFKYTPRGGRVRLGVRGAGQRVRVEVADSGPGIPEGEEALIFERYYRGGGITVQGTGLGLAIARGIVEQHGGSIWAENGEPEGARFIFEVPVEQVAA
jgi:signal transduction histidine kinase